MKRTLFQYLAPLCETVPFLQGADICLIGSNDEVIDGGDDDDITW